MNEKTAKWQIELASAIAGGKDRLKAKPLFSTIHCPVAPLSFEKGSSEAMCTLARAGIPIAPMTMVLAGTSGPATMAGTLALANAEELASLVIVECANPGAPMIYCAEIAPADMRSGAINYDAPEYPLLVTGCTQMAKFYGLPSRDCPTRNDLSQENSYESSSTESLLEIPLELMSRADLAGSVGDDPEDVALTASLVKVVLDCEAHAHGRAYLRSFEISDDTLALDVIKQVGPGGNFLGERHTVEHFRREFFNRKPSDPFILDPGSKGSLVDRAKAKVREILSAHQPLPIEETVHGEMMRILREAEKDIV